MNASSSPLQEAARKVSGSCAALTRSSIAHNPGDFQADAIALRDDARDLLALLSEEREEPPQDVEAIVAPVLKALDALPRGDGYTRLHFAACDAHNKLIEMRRPATPSEVETAQPPQSLEHDGKWYDLFLAGNNASCRVPQINDLLRLPNGEFTNPYPLGEGYYKGLCDAGSALYRLRVEPPQPPVPVALELLELAVHRGLYLIPEGERDTYKKAEEALRELLKRAAPSLTQGGGEDA
jgi:hypothetical protein